MKHTRTYRLLPLLLVLLTVTSAVLPAHAVTDQDAPDAEYPECYQQNDSRWSGKELIGPNGCGLISLVNAVHYLTGNFIDPVPLAVYAHEIDAYNGSVGGGTARWVLYHQLQDYEKTYGFKVVQTGHDGNVREERFITHLRNGGVAVCHVSGHFIAIVGYDASEKRYLVYDSAANYDRRGTHAEATWLSTKQLTTTDYMTVDWWCLIEKTVSSVNEVSGHVWTDQCVTASLHPDADGRARIAGAATVSRGVASLYYVLDYDYEHMIPVEGDHTAGENEKLDFDFTVDLSALSAGRHTLRLSAVTADGGISDIVEYMVTKPLPNAPDGVDEATGDLIVGMSGFLGRENIHEKYSVTKFDGAIWRALPDDVLYLGSFDLSQYDHLIVTYATRNAFDCVRNGVQGIVGVKSRGVSYGSVDEPYDMEGNLAYADLTNGGSFDTPRDAVIDLSGVDYNGKVYLSLYNPMKDAIIVEMLRFVRDPAAPETEAPTEAPTEPETEPVTEPVTDAPETQTETEPESVTAVEDVTGTEAEEDPGCASALMPVSVLLLLAAAPALVARKRRRE